MPSRRLVVQKVTIREVLNHISHRVPSIIKDLRAQVMSTNTPNRLILLLSKPLMTQCLCVEIIYFKRAVVDMRSVVCAYEKAVVIYNPIATIGVSEERDVPPLAFLLHVQEVA